MDIHLTPPMRTEIDRAVSILKILSVEKGSLEIARQRRASLEKTLISNARIGVTPTCFDIRFIADATKAIESHDTSGLVRSYDAALRRIGGEIMLQQHIPGVVIPSGPARSCFQHPTEDTPS